MALASSRRFSLSGNADLALAGLVTSVVALLVVPLPTPVLDLLLTANIGFAVVLLLSGVYVGHALRLSTFPSLLLLATLFRLALNVSSTRLILADADAGRVIEAFGAFVVRGNYVVGAVVFTIVTVIQFVVIAKGSERVAEVAARFTLDAMPGRQMAIDADLRAGALTLADARAKRAELQRESQLFGAMDGAMKFVKGDAIAGLIITIVNVVGGLIIGVMQRDMSVGDAAQLYTLLTIGDGLVSQIPALLVSVAAGLVVTRVAAPGDDARDLGSEIASQLAGSPRVFGVASTLLVLLGLVPGLPLVPFVGLGAACAGVAVHLSRAQARAASEDEVVQPTATSSESPLVPLATPVTLEVGATVAAGLRAASDEARLRDEIRMLREALFARLGVRLPAVRMRMAPPGLPPDALRVSIWDVVEHATALRPDRRLVLAPPDVLAAAGVPVEPSIHPRTGGRICTIDPAHADAVRAAGHNVLELADEVMLHAAAAVQRGAEQFVGLAEVQAGLDALEPTHGALIDAVVPRPLSLASLTGVLRRLVQEGVPIRDLRAVLEAMAEDARDDHDIVELTEIARRGLRRAIVAARAQGGVLRAWLVSHDIEQTVRDCIVRTDGNPHLAMPPSVSSELLAAFGRHLVPDRPALVVASSDVRRYLRQLVVLQRPDAVVLGLAEVHDGVRLEPLGTIGVGE